MRAWTDAGIFLRTPIDKIVPAFAAGPGMIGNLVGGQAVGGANVLGGVEERPRGVFIGKLQFAGGMERRKRRVLLDGQLVERQMLAGFAQSACATRLPIAPVPGPAAYR